MEGMRFLSMIVQTRWDAVTLVAGIDKTQRRAAVVFACVSLDLYFSRSSIRRQSSLGTAFSKALLLANFSACRRVMHHRPTLLTRFCSLRARLWKRSIVCVAPNCNANTGTPFFALHALAFACRCEVQCPRAKDRVLFAGHVISNVLAIWRDLKKNSNNNNKWSYGKHATRRVVPVPESNRNCFRIFGVSAEAFVGEEDTTEIRVSH